MTLSLLPRPDAREGRDRLEILTALISAPSFDPLFRGDIITIPAGHPVYRWNCLASGCGRPARSGDLCDGHERLWRKRRGEGGPRAGFLQAPPPAGGPGAGTEEHPCRICPERAALHLALRLCQHHLGRWDRYRARHGDDAGFSEWLAGQQPAPGFGCCRVRVCPELAHSPLGLCKRHGVLYRSQGRPGGAALPGEWALRYEKAGKAVPVRYADEPEFRRWCAAAAPAARPGQVNLRGLHPLVRAEFQWCMASGAAVRTGREGLACLQRLAEYARVRALGSLTELSAEDAGLAAETGRQGPQAVRMITGRLALLYVTPEQAREEGYILAGHFGRELPRRSGRTDLSGISQRWLRDLVWDYMAGLLRSPGCPRTAGPFDDMRRAGLELSAFLGLRAPGGGHDPRALTAGHMHQFAADQRQREHDGLVSLGVTGRHGEPSVVTAVTRQAVFNCTRRLLRGALESGEAGRLGLDRGFITSMPAHGPLVTRSRPPFTDEVARALADEENLRKLARDHDPSGNGTREAWETIIATGRRCGEVLNLRLDCLGRYGGLPMLWHDQSKVGNYDEAVRIPDRVWQALKARQRKTLALFQSRNNRPPTADERAAMALFPSPARNRDCSRPLTDTWFHGHFRAWVADLDTGRQVPHQARHTMATSLLRAGATLSHVRRYLGHVSERMSERYIHLAHSDLEDVL
ncbi:MAG: tyrosine-type recombinase/integrase, partial [Nocardiopsaceae bacterium]|nr:tyrosine-type recombinase/integrase [Nocardiopsaceae bacterium]